MDRHDIRYMLEHRLLPQWFFEDKDKFVSLLLKNKGILFDVIDEIFQKETVDNPYSADQFGVEAAKLADEVFMIKIIFPEPEEEPLCYSSYLFFNLTFDKFAYFCIEKGNSAGDDYPFVCSWTKNGTHCNHGNCTFEEDNDFWRCADIYMKSEYGSELDSEEE